jgi:hypothetical protein
MAVLRVAAVGTSGGRQRRGHPIDFEDWIRAQLALSPQASQGAGAAGRLKLRAPKARPAHLLQAFTAGAAVAFFAVGLMAGAPLPAMQILPAQKPQSLPVTSLGVAPAPAALAAEAPAATATAASTPGTSRTTTHHRVERRPDLGSRTYYTGQPRSGATSFSSPRLNRSGR